MLNITFDPHGDVKLVLSTSGGLGTSPTAAQFLVNSGVLCLASPVFRAMLGANSCFKERKDLAANSQNSNNPPLEVRLSDDNPEGLAIILRIIHLHYQWIPSYKNICQSRLYQIAIICDKYEMKHAILYWFRQWSRSLQEDTSSWSGEEACKWLYIAYAFGDDSLFMKLSRELILHTKIDPSGGLTLPLLEFVPQAVIDEIQAMRQKAVDSMIGMIYVQIHQYSNPQHIRCAFKDPLCDATILGLLIRALHGIKLDVYAITAADTTEPRSITELKELLDQITFPDFLIQHDGSPTAGPEDYYSPFISTISHYHQCSSCRNLFPSPPKKNTQGVKHTEKCSPLPKLKENLDKIWQSIQGLDYSRFIGGANKNHFAGTGSGDLWNTVCLKD